jgi:hypothetical protein
MGRGYIIPSHNYMKTRNGIYYDLSKSTYKFKVPDTNITFIFSSDLHLLKFEEQYLNNRYDYNLKLTVRLKIPIIMKVVPDVVLYRKIETRGFLLIDEGGQKICQENVQLNGEKVTRKN